MLVTGVICPISEVLHGEQGRLLDALLLPDSQKTTAGLPECRIFFCITGFCCCALEPLFFRHIYTVAPWAALLGKAATAHACQQSFLV
jgi:hypothetical protein